MDSKTAKELIIKIDAIDIRVNTLRKRFEEAVENNGIKSYGHFVPGIEINGSDVYSLKFSSPYVECDFIEWLFDEFCHESEEAKMLYHLDNVRFNICRYYGLLSKKRGPVNDDVARDMIGGLYGIDSILKTICDRLLKVL